MNEREIREVVVQGLEAGAVPGINRIEVRAAFPHPRQWAPFVLAGNGFVPIPALLPEGEVTR